MTFREMRAFILLYQAADPALRERVAQLVPEIAEWDVERTALSKEWKPISEAPTTGEWIFRLGTRLGSRLARSMAV